MLVIKIKINKYLVYFPGRKFCFMNEKTLMIKLVIIIEVIKIFTEKICKIIIFYC